MENLTLKAFTRIRSPIFLPPALSHFLLSRFSASSFLFCSNSFLITLLSTQIHVEPRFLYLCLGVFFPNYKIGIAYETTIGECVQEIQDIFFV